MKRKQFLASLLAFVAAPVVAKQIIEEKPKPAFNVKKLKERYNYIQTHRESYRGGLTPQEVLEIYNETGVLLYTNVRIVQ